MTRLYCTLEDLLSISPLGFKRESVALDAIRQASQFLEGKKQLNGHFIPVTAAKRFDGNGTIDLFLKQELLSITSIVEDGTTLATTDYLTYPRNKYWENGPITRLRVDPDASNLSVWTFEEDVVVITGTWGKYAKTQSTGESVTFADATGTVLTVTDGSSVSVGMILLCESEQMAVTATGAVSDSTTDVNEASGITVDDDIFTVDDGSVFSEFEVIKIDNEQMRILDISSNDLYVARAWNGTKRATHLNNADVYVYRKYTVERGVNGTTAAAHASKDLSQYVAPYDVKWLCKQIAGLMVKKQESHFAGKTADADLGEVFYLDEFPKKQIAETRQNYRINIR